MNVPAVSVIIPTYNHCDYVLEAIASVFAQTLADHEIIVVNDGSSDDTAKVLRPLAEGGRIRYVEQPNGGQASARNRGLSIAQGEFIAFLDDDDCWPPDKLQWQLDTLRSRDAVLVGGWMQFFGEGGEAGGQWGLEPGTITKETLAKGCPFYSPGQTLIRRSALEQVGGFDPAIWGVDDHDLYLRLLQAGSLLIDRRISLFYRLHQHNASRQRDRMLVNGLTVVRRHFPDPATSLARHAYRWLYDYAGRNQIQQAWHSVRRGQLRVAVRELSVLRPLAWYSLRHNLKLGARMVRDALRIMFGRSG